MTETTGPEKLKMYILWFFIEKNCPALCCITSSERRDLHHKTLRLGMGYTKVQLLHGKPEQNGSFNRKMMEGEEYYLTGIKPVYQM